MARKRSEEWRLIQGIVPDSIEECRFATGLEAFKLVYDYQALFGTFGAPGSAWIDFLVWLPPLKACSLEGPYWHSKLNEAEDMLKYRMVEEAIGSPVIIFPTEDLDTQENTNQQIKKKLLS